MMIQNTHKPHCDCEPTEVSELESRVIWKKVMIIAVDAVGVSPIAMACNEDDTESAQPAGYSTGT